jgi:hypothetical protein
LRILFEASVGSAALSKNRTDFDLGIEQRNAPPNVPSAQQSWKGLIECAA